MTRRLTQGSRARIIRPSPLDMSQTVLDREWESLMALCRHETELKQSGTHPKLLQMVAREIDRAATKMGFDEAQIRRREFRAEKANGRVIGLLRL